MHELEKRNHDEKQEQALIKRLGAPIKACYWNSIRATAHLKSGYYVEGLVKDFALGGLIYEHAWHETPDGLIIDTTLAALNRTSALLYCTLYRFEYAELRAAGIIKPYKRYTKFGALHESDAYWYWAYGAYNAIKISKEARHKCHVVKMDLLGIDHNYEFEDVRTISDKE